MYNLCQWPTHNTIFIDETYTDMESSASFEWIYPIQVSTPLVLACLYLISGVAEIYANLYTTKVKFQNNMGNPIYKWIGIKDFIFLAKS